MRRLEILTSYFNYQPYAEYFFLNQMFKFQNFKGTWDVISNPPGMSNSQ